MVMFISCAGIIALFYIQFILYKPAVSVPVPAGIGENL